MSRLILLTALAVAAAPAAAMANGVMRAEMRDAKQWFQRVLAADAAPPFSFCIAGRPAAPLLSGWMHTRSDQRIDGRRVRRTVQWTDPSSRLTVTMAAIAYSDYPTVEWTIRLRNGGTVDTPLLTDIRALDTRLMAAGEHVTLHHWTGSPCAPNDYQPHASPLASNTQLSIATSGGRPTNSDMPYFNLEWTGGGAIAAIGWPGQWAAHFERDGGNSVRLSGGQELTRLVLRPGEEIRTPLAVLQFWRGERAHAQNVWRRWMLAHNLPRPDSKPVGPLLIMCTSDSYPGMQSTAAGEIAFADAYADAGVRLDYWWIDAGWYPCDGPGWPRVGTWEPDPVRYPRGIREVADHVHRRGMKLVVWFEPERVAPGTWLAEHHPEWVLGGRSGGLLDLGNAEARAWLTNHMDRLISDNRVDLYRQDFNMDPLPYWRANDAPDRQGMTEIRHVEGYLAYWDELRRRHPGMLIDSCASGGRRNDLETLRRAVPLLRSDYRFEPNGTQGHTFGIASWIPYFGTGVPDTSDYVVRSHWCPCLGIGRDEPRKPGLDWTTYRRMVAEWRASADLMLGDYYPLTAYSLDPATWIAWQFDRPEKGDGMVQAFRRQGATDDLLRVRLSGLTPTRRYRLTDLDTQQTTVRLGSDLMGAGITVRAPMAPYAAVIRYRTEH